MKHFSEVGEGAAGKSDSSPQQEIQLNLSGKGAVFTEKKKKKKGEAERNGSGVRQLGSILVLILLSSVNLGKLNSLCLSFLIEIIIVSHRGVA